MRFAYYRVSSADQSVEAQRHALGGQFDREFQDEGVSGGVLAAKRPGFAALLNVVREGDTLSVYSVDRLGRDALDVQMTVRALIERGVSVEVLGLGQIARGVGELILAVLAQVAEMERRRIVERASAGRAAAKASLAATGKTHRGKTSLGRPQAANPAVVVKWREQTGASIAKTAKYFGLGRSTVKRYLVSAKR
jgi:putative DNA-invertase from lambdoid prophage Rac